MVSSWAVGSEAGALLFSFRPLLYGFSAPVDIANAHDGSNRLFIAQQGGLIKVWNGTAVSDFIDLSSVINTEGYERGLLSLAFHPRFNGTTNRYFFVYYTNTESILIKYYCNGVFYTKLQNY